MESLTRHNYRRLGGRWYLSEHAVAKNIQHFNGYFKTTSFRFPMNMSQNFFQKYLSWDPQHSFHLPTLTATWFCFTKMLEFENPNITSCLFPWIRKQYSKNRTKICLMAVWEVLHRSLRRTPSLVLQSLYSQKWVQTWKMWSYGEQAVFTKTSDCIYAFPLDSHTKSIWSFRNSGVCLSSLWSPEKDQSLP